MITPATHGLQLSLLPHDGRTRAVFAGEEYDVYAGRPRGNLRPEHVPVGEPGWLGNPHRVGTGCSTCGYKPHSVEEALALFESYFLARVRADDLFRDAVLALKGKRLGCPGCPTGSPCHAGIIARWVEENAQ